MDGSGIVRVVALDLDRFLAVRPFVFHLTSLRNLPSIRASGKLESASTLNHKAGGAVQSIRQRREKSVDLPMGSQSIRLRDQYLLREANIAFSDGCDFPTFVQILNSLVFFWPGNASGPSRTGRKHFFHYEHEGPGILRVDTVKLLSGNGDLTPLFSRCNSGSPRINPRAGKARRGTDTFLPADQFIGPSKDVVELVFEGGVALPPCTELGNSPEGPWYPLFPS
jgi:hypothetical protein